MSTAALKKEHRMPSKQRREKAARLLRADARLRSIGAGLLPPAGIKAPAHTDAVCLDTTVEADGVIWIKDGRFVEPELAAAADRLLQTALDNGGRDNISMVLLIDDTGAAEAGENSCEEQNAQEVTENE